MTDKLKCKAELLGRFRYPFIILIAGVLLLLLPSGSSQKNVESDSSGLLAQVLSCSEGVGDTRVLISDSGVSSSVRARQTRRSDWILSARLNHILATARIRSQFSE